MGCSGSKSTKGATLFDNEASRILNEINLLTEDFSSSFYFFNSMTPQSSSSSLPQSPSALSFLIQQKISELSLISSQISKLDSKPYDALTKSASLVRSINELMSTSPLYCVLLLEALERAAQLFAPKSNQSHEEKKCNNNDAVSPKSVFRPPDTPPPSQGKSAPNAPYPKNLKSPSPFNDIDHNNNTVATKLALSFFGFGNKTPQKSSDEMSGSSNTQISSVSDQRDDDYGFFCDLDL